MPAFKKFLFFLVLFDLNVITFAYIEGLYCGLDNCYDVLGVTRDDSKDVFTKAYRKLARKWHPDRHRGEEAKAKASDMFKKIANAYEILKDDDQRNDYDYMLDNPDEYYSIYYQYYRRRVAPQIDVRLVIAVTITIISVLQYWNGWNNYHTALGYLVTVPKYRITAQEIARREGLIDEKRKREKGKTKEEQKQEEEEILKQIIEDKMDIKGTYKKPSIMDILWLQLLFCPYYIARFFWFWMRWLWLFTICRNEYGREEQEYLIRYYMGLSKLQWQSLEESTIDHYLKLELWRKENFLPWKKEQDDIAKAKLAESSRYKSYRRWMKKGGPGRMTFEED